MDDGPPLKETVGPAPGDIATGLVEIWQRKLRVSPIAAADDFFELGGDSVLAVEMLLEVERQFGVEPPLTLLTGGLTLAVLTNWLEAQRDDPHLEPEQEHAPVLVPLRADGSKPPFFLVHGVGLPSLRGAFADGLDPAQPIYIFQHRGLDGKTAPNRTIEEMAADYITAMRDVRPEGPYLLGGACAGAYVALEMAHQLTRYGESVPMIFLIDPPSILGAFVGRWPLSRYTKRAAAFLWRKATGLFDRERRRSRRAKNEGKIRSWAMSPASTAARGSTRVKDVAKAQESFIKALRKYRPRPYRGIINLVQPVDQERPRQSAEAFWSKAYDDVRVCWSGRPLTASSVPQ